MGHEVLGGFEHQVLLALLRLGTESYTVPLVEELEELTGRAPAPAAVYTTLRRLEARGLLSSELVPSPDGGRPRRTFELQPEAVELLRDSKATFQRFWKGLTALDPV